VDYAYSQLRLSEVLVSAYPANQASIKLIGKLPVKPVEDQDGKKRFLIENN
jgi:predicted acetyltransferase